ncbi:hypothetical protein M7I_1912 [Glarea lozoyensis 74030]|uniref:2EXR domain-containing protein n=1 Tax=Glarea lozoyensis (strain ATCC 74030 / MF5533) TaxID=1104152 RepID=H0EHD4_GLAL7|nr:hypothetical protein M7I_1912 [Glarea lozoyensis 74030]
MVCMVSNGLRRKIRILPFQAPPKPKLKGPRKKPRTGEEEIKIDPIREQARIEKKKLKAGRRPKQYKHSLSEGYTGVDLDHFHLYNKLPIELRTMILKHAAVPRKICLHFRWMRQDGKPKGQKFALKWQTDVPAMLAVDRETRTLAKLFYKPLLHISLGGLVVYFNYETDILYFGRKLLKDVRLLKQWFSNSFNLSSSNTPERMAEVKLMCKNVRHIAINNLQWLPDLALILGEFQHLQTITCYHKEEYEIEDNVRVGDTKFLEFWKQKAIDRKQTDYKTPVFNFSKTFWQEYTDVSPKAIRRRQRRKEKIEHRRDLLFRMACKAGDSGPNRRKRTVVEVKPYNWWVKDEETDKSATASEK